MKYVSSGDGKLPLITLISILSVSLTVNLPGLAISPIMEKLDDVFPDTTQLQIQLLSVLPNLIIIPFIIFSGKLASTRNQTWVLSAGLAIFTLSAVLYFFAESMSALILISCLLGVGCGLVIPIAAGLIAEHLYGRARFRALGMESGVSNGMVILATLFVGWMADYGWHACFAVYLIPLIPLALMPYMTNRFVSRHHIAATPQDNKPPQTAPRSDTTDSASSKAKGKLPLKTLAGLVALYLTITYCVIVFSYYLPFTMKHYGFGTRDVGVASAMFYVTATTGGFILPWFLHRCGRTSPFVALGISAIGIFMLGIMHTYASYIIGVLLIGFGYGIMQPVIYNKTTRIAPDQKSDTRFLSIVLTGNYIAIAIAPFVVEFFEFIFHDRSVDFPFFLNGIIMAATILIGLIMRRSFIWNTDPSEV